MNSLKNNPISHKLCINRIESAIIKDKMHQTITKYLPTLQYYITITVRDRRDTQKDKCLYKAPALPNPQGNLRHHHFPC